MGDHCNGVTGGALGKSGVRRKWALQGFPSSTVAASV